MYKDKTELKGDEVGFMTIKSIKSGKEYHAVFHSAKQYDMCISRLTDDDKIILSYITRNPDNYGKEKHDIVMRNLGYEPDGVTPLINERWGK